MSAIDVLSETELEVRDARPDDVHAIAAIYAWHVLHGRASLKKSLRLLTKCVIA